MPASPWPGSLKLSRPFLPASNCRVERGAEGSRTHHGGSSEGRPARVSRSLLRVRRRLDVADGFLRRCGRRHASPAAELLQQLVHSLVGQGRECGSPVPASLIRFAGLKTPPGHGHRQEHMPPPLSGDVRPRAVTRAAAGSKARPAHTDQGLPGHTRITARRPQEPSKGDRSGGYGLAPASSRARVSTVDRPGL